MGALKVKNTIDVQKKVVEHLKTKELLNHLTFAELMEVVDFVIKDIENNIPNACDYILTNIGVENNKGSRDTIYGKDIVFFSDMRISSSQKSDDVHYYDIRHSDDIWGEPATIEKDVLVNYYGTIGLRSPIDFKGKDHIVLNEKEKAVIQNIMAEI